MTMRMSNYLDTLWSAENPTWSMYFLNGQDNSLIMISTLSLKDMATRYKESAISSRVNGRRAEMLQQANALDERESFSPLRHFALQNDHYFTVYTTFNQPGHLSTVVAFNLPVNELIPQNMPMRTSSCVRMPRCPPPAIRKRAKARSSSSSIPTWRSPPRCRASRCSWSIA
nr:Sensor-like histidine kinase RcsD [Candidatus Pantoea persica]